MYNPTHSPSIHILSFAELFDVTHHDALPIVQFECAEGEHEHLDEPQAALPAARSASEVGNG